jgi:hypothetical protein
VAIFSASLFPAVLAQADDDLSVTISVDSQKQVTPGTSIELHLNRAIKTNEGRIAVIIGRADVTSLFIADGARFVYSPSLVPLPLGESEIVIYLVDANNAWRQLGQFQLHVVSEASASASASNKSETPASASGSNESLTPASVNGRNGSAPPATNGLKASSLPAPAAGSSPDSTTKSGGRFGFEKFENVPSLTLAIKSQPAQFNFPESTRPAARATFTDGTLQFSMRNQMSRGWFGTETSFDFAGSTFGQEALRFSTLGEKAPQVDLSSYLVQLKLGRAKMAIGHTSFGTSRHLISGFSSRGITFNVPITKRFDFGLAVLNGTSIVGYGNFFGVAKDKHQLQTATIGIELAPKRPGGIRLEFSGVNAYIQALNSVSQGSVNDVERSKGGSVRLVASDKSGRFKFDGGFTRSQYRNPADPLLYQGTKTVAVPFLTRNARYFDVSYDVLKGRKITKSKQLNLSLALRHEQVDPLYKSLGASAGADKRQNDFQLTGSVGEISFQAGYGRFNDNLRHVASILQSLTRSQQYSIALPAAALWGGTSNTSKYLPRLSYSLSSTHQFGAAIPINGGFAIDPGSVPDQISTNQNFSSDWQFQKVTFGYSYNRSFSDNRQPARAKSDFRNQTNGVRAGLNPTSKLSINFELTRDSASDLAGDKLVRTWRAGPTMSWTLNKHLSWTASVSNTIAGDRAQTNGSRNTEFDTQFSYRVGLDRGELKKVQTQMFIRFADRYARSRDATFSTFSLTRTKLVNAGVNISFF